MGPLIHNICLCFTLDDNLMQPASFIWVWDQPWLVFAMGGVSCLVENKLQNVHITL